MGKICEVTKSLSSTKKKSVNKEAFLAKERERKRFVRKNLKRWEYELMQKILRKR